MTDTAPPPELIAALGADSIDLDPCSPINRPWPTAKRHFTIEDNGLGQPWAGRVWLNPPYSTSVIGTWLARLAQHNCGVALIFARTETDAFFRHVWERASAVLFMRGRINFQMVDGRRALRNSGAPSVLCAYGFDDAEIVAGSGIEGQFVPLLLPRFWPATFGHRTWREVIASLLRSHNGPMSLAELYRGLASHPKAKRNPNYEAKIRQELQRGPFRRVSRGTWEFRFND